MTPTKKKTGAKPGPKVPAALRTQLERLGLTVHGEPVVPPSSLGVEGTTEWLAHLTPPPGAFRSEEVRALRFVRPFAVPRTDPNAAMVVIGQTSDHWLTVPARYGDRVRLLPLPATPREGAARSALPTFLSHLEPDASTPARDAVDPVTLSPRLESLVIASLANVGVLDVRPGAVPADVVARLESLSLVGMDALDEIDERFSGLTTLAVRDGAIDDLTPLARLPRLRRLMLYGCVLGSIEPLAAAPALEALHLPHCLLTQAQLEVLRTMPRLTSVTLTGNRLGPDARAFVDALPKGLDPDGTKSASLELNAKLAAQPSPTAGVVRATHTHCSVLRGGRVRFGSFAGAGGPGQVQSAVKNATLIGESPGNDDVEMLLAWPAERRVGPSARLEVPVAILEQLARLGVTFDESATGADLPTATLRKLAQARWPDRVLRSQSGARIEMTDYRPTRLHRTDVLRPPRACIGSFGSEHMLVIVAESADPDPHVYAVDVEEPSTPSIVQRYPLSELLRSLRVGA